MTDSAQTSFSVDQPVNLTDEQEERFPMREKDWKRVRRSVESISKARREFAAVAWAFVEVCASAIIAAITWAPAYETMEPEIQLDFSWIHPAFVIAAFASGVIAGLMFWAAHVSKDVQSSTVRQVLDDIDEIWEPSLKM